MNVSSIWGNPWRSTRPLWSLKVCTLFPLWRTLLALYWMNCNTASYLSQISLLGDTIINYLSDQKYIQFLETVTKDTKTILKKILQDFIIRRADVSAGSFWSNVKTSGVFSSHSILSEFSVKLNMSTFIGSKFLEANELSSSFWAHLCKLHSTSCHLLNWLGSKDGRRDLHSVTYNLILISPYHFTLTSFLQGLLVSRVPLLLTFNSQDSQTCAWRQGCSPWGNTIETVCLDILWKVLCGGSRIPRPVRSLVKFCPFTSPQYLPISFISKKENGGMDSRTTVTGIGKLLNEKANSTTVCNKHRPHLLRVHALHIHFFNMVGL